MTDGSHLPVGKAPPATAAWCPLSAQPGRRAPSRTGPRPAPRLGSPSGPTSQTEAAAKDLPRPSPVPPTALCVGPWGSTRHLGSEGGRHLLGTTELFAAPGRGRPSGAARPPLTGRLKEMPQSAWPLSSLWTEVPTDAALTDALTRLAPPTDCPSWPTGAVRCARPADARLADVLTSTRLVTTTWKSARHLPPLAAGCRPMTWRCSTGAVQAIGLAAGSSPRTSPSTCPHRPDLPRRRCPGGPHTCQLVAQAHPPRRHRRYGTRRSTPGPGRCSTIARGHRVPGIPRLLPHRARHRPSAHESCAGRARRPTPPVCALGIHSRRRRRKAPDAFFERFLSPGRASYRTSTSTSRPAAARGRQYVYSRYGLKGTRAAQVASVISCAPDPIRDAARALRRSAGRPPGQADGAVDLQCAED